MVFSSLFFLYAFLPLCLIAYSIPRQIKHKNWVLLAFSLFFYAWGEPFWIIQMVLSGTLVYACARLMESCDKRKEPGLRKTFFVLSLVLALLPLLVFKYSDFFINNLNVILGTEIPLPGFSLPIGISFYTFQILSYSIDLYRGKCKLQKRWDYFLLYQSFFPQLIAGPIVRYSDIEARLEDRKSTPQDISQGAQRFVLGLAKKCLIANYAGSLVEQTLASDRLAQLSGLEALIGIIAFTFQIYYDFSAYSDMAIGLGRIFGFQFLENFDYPYKSRSATEFWRRWHISLGSFFRDYVYIPLGGNRRRQYFNLLVTWFLTGFWHGASWNFILWGLYYLIFIVIEKAFLLDRLERLPKFVSYIYMVPVVVFGWALFYFTDLSDLGIFLSRLFCANGGTFLTLEGKLLLRQNIFALIFCLVFSLPLWPRLQKAIQGQRSKLAWQSQKSYLVLSLTQMVILLVLSTASLAGDSYNPFLYFRF